MRIFGRGRNSPQETDETPDEALEGSTSTIADQTDHADGADHADRDPVGDDPDTLDRSGQTEATDGEPAVVDPDPAVDRSSGPFDVTEVDDGRDRLDLGALRVAPEPGTELRLEVEQESQQLISVTAVVASSQVQLSAFAAPRTAGIWSEIRSEITSSVLEGGGTAEHRSGPLGVELQARIPSQAPDGRTVFAPARFIGVDGPRWFLRAVLYGPAAVDDAAAEPLFDLIRGVVVVRGEQAMAPRELLPLRLPEDPAISGADDADAAAADDERDADDLKPFERGPEITEVH